VGKERGQNEGCNKEGWPKWMKDGYTLLDACPAGGVREWSTAVETWARLEEAYGFQSSVWS
jgi:hypothetical protein